MPNRPLIQAVKPVSATAGVAAGALATGAFATGSALTGAGLGTAIGAGASGSTPLITGSCLLARSCVRRVTVVGSSVSSAMWCLACRVLSGGSGGALLRARESGIGRFQRLVGHHDHVQALLEFDLGDLGALLVQQERR